MGGLEGRGLLRWRFSAGVFRTFLLIVSLITAGSTWALPAEDTASLLSIVKRVESLKRGGQIDRASQLLDSALTKAHAAKDERHNNAVALKMYLENDSA